MTQAAQLYRQKALSSLDSPEKLDRMMRVSPTYSWLALVAVIIVLMAAMVWSLVGTIPTMVEGGGLLIRPDGLTEVRAHQVGKVSLVTVKVGSQVAADEVIAKVDQPKLTAKIDALKAQWVELTERHEQIRLTGAAGSELNQNKVAQQRRAAHNKIATLASRRDLLEHRKNAQVDLFREGLITKQNVDAVQRDLDGTILELENASTQLKALSVTEQGLKANFEREMFASENGIHQLERRLETLKQEHTRNSVIRAPEAGRVVELRLNPGDLLIQGFPVANIEPTRSNNHQLEAIFYVPAGDGKQINVGMDVQVSPSVVRREEFGFVEGTVRGVGMFPVSRQGMSRILMNDGLVDQFVQAAGGPPIEVRVELKRDSETFSGLQWSSKNGPNIQLHPGTISSARITVRNQRPIELVLPLLRTTLDP